MGALDDLDKALGAKGFGQDDDDDIGITAVDYTRRDSNLSGLDAALERSFGESSKQQTQAPMPVTSPVDDAEEPTGFFAKALNAGKTAVKFGADAWNSVMRAKDEAINFVAEPLSRTPLIRDAGAAYAAADRGELELDTFSYLGEELLKGTKEPVLTLLNTETGRKTSSFLAENSSNLPLKGLAALSAIGDQTYDQAYDAWLAERNDPENPTWQKFLYELQDSGVQSAVGALLSIGTTIATRSPKAGITVGGGFYTAIAADEQIQKEGRVYSQGNLAIDVVGDSLLNGLLLRIFKEPSKSVWKAVAQGFGTEGSTEVAQSLLKYLNDYGNAKTEDDKLGVLAEAKKYVVSGGILMEFMVGGVAGGVITGAGTAINRRVNPSQQPSREEPEKGGKKPPAGKQEPFRVPDEEPDTTTRQPMTEGFTPSFSEDVNEMRDQAAAFARSGGSPNPEIVRTVDAVNDYATAFADRTVYIPSDKTAAPLISISTVEFPDGKVATRFEANVTGAGFASEFDFNQLFNTQEAATASAQEAILAWARTELETEQNTERKALLEKLIDYADNPRAPIDPSKVQRLAKAAVAEESESEGDEDADIDEDTDTEDGEVRNTAAKTSRTAEFDPKRNMLDINHTIYQNFDAKGEGVELIEKDGEFVLATESALISAKTRGKVMVFKSAAEARKWAKERGYTVAKNAKEENDRRSEEKFKDMTTEALIKKLEDEIGAFPEENRELDRRMEAAGKKWEWTEDGDIKVTDAKKPAPKKETNEEKVRKAVAEKGEAKAKEIAEATGVLEPSVRRILGVGTKKGDFERIAEGVYRLRIDGEDIAYIHAADAVKELPRLAAEGFKADMVFLDIPYDTKAVKGGSKGGAPSGQVGGGVQYNLISVKEFDTVLDAVAVIARKKSTPVIHMFSQAESGLKDMERYNDLFIKKGWVPVGRGEYQKLNKNGTLVGRPTGAGYQTSKPEGILVFTRSGELDKELGNLNFKLVRPKGYQTEKPAEMLAELIEMTTEEGDVVLDPFAGSGVTGAEAVKKGRKTVLIEKNEEVVENVTKPRVEEAARSRRIGLMDYDPSYTENMKRLIKEAQDNGDTFPYLKMSKEEQAIIDNAFRNGLNAMIENNAPRTLAEKRAAKTAKPAPKKKAPLKKASTEITLIEEVDPRLDGDEKPKQLVNKTALRTILGDDKSLDFTVEVDYDNAKFIKWERGNGSGRIRLAALGLTGETLEQGDTVRVTKDALKDKGSDFALTGKGAEATIAAFGQSVVQENIGSLGDAEIVIGTYGVNAITRKTDEKKTDRIEMRELPDTIPHVVEALKAGDSTFRKDNLVLIAQMPTGELRAIVTRQNAAGQEEVINFFRVGKNPVKFLENLRSFGAPERTRTSTLALEPRSPIQLADGGMGNGSTDASGSIDPATLTGGKNAFAGVWDNGADLLTEDARKPAKLPKKEEVDHVMGGMEYVHAAELPELVDLARDLMGRVPDVKKATGKAAGRFHAAGGGRITLIAALFEKGGNHLEAARTLAHEIGHLTDYLPDRNMSRGNLLGRLFTLKKFMSSAFSTEAGAFTSEERKSIRDAITKEVLEEKGISFGDMVGGKLEPKEKKELAAEIKKRFKKEMDAKLKSGGFIKDETLRKELLAVTRWWHPYDPKKVPDSYRRYRESSVELYAEALSVLLNAPTRLKQMAPTFYNNFFEALDQKPEVRDAYFELQALLGGDREILVKSRREGVQSMFGTGDRKALDIEKQRWAERETRRKRYWFNFKHHVLDKNFSLIDRVKEVQKKGGEKLNPDENPVFFLEERNYLGGKIKALFESTFNSIYQDVTVTNDVPWEQFGEYLFYSRIAAGDRSSVANPRGITPDAATELIADMRKALGDEVMASLEGNAEKFRAAIKDIATEAYESGLYTKELYDQMQENPAYVTFQVLDHLEDGMTSRVYKSIGTLKDIANPADSSMLKLITTIRATERNNVTKSVVQFLEENFGSEIEEAKYVFNGKTRVPVQPKGENQELLTFFEDGKMRGVYVDAYIAQSVNNESVGRVLAELTGLRFMNSTLFRPLFITFNLGFQSFNLIRDFVRFYKNVPDMTLARAAKRYGQSMRIAKVRAFGAGKSAKDQEALQLLALLENERVFSVTFGDLIAGETEFDSQVQKILADTGIKDFQPAPRFEQVPKFAKPAVKALDKAGILKVTSGILDTIKRMGDFIETLPKAAGVYEFQSKSEDGTLTREQRSYIRRKLGSPDFLAGGTFKPLTNEVFLFSNAIMQGIRADIEVASDPQTRGAFWWKTAKVVVIPKLLMFAALLGFMGRDMEEMMGDASEYDRTSYTIIPLGKDENNKTIYFRLPVDETSRFIGGLTWKMLRLVSGGNQQTVGQQLADLVSYTGGQLPSVSPVIGTLAATMQYISGNNPYDAFRGRYVLSDDVYKAGGAQSAKAFGGWLFQQMGGGIFYRFYHEPTAPKEKSGAEKFVNMPFLGNIIGRFVRVSDYGAQESLKGVQKAAEKEEAKRRIRERELVNKYVEEAQERGIKFSTYTLEQEMVKEYLEGRAQPKDKKEAERVGRLIKKFQLSFKRGGAEAEVIAVMDADSNDQKVEILMTLKEKMTDEEFATLRADLLRSKVASQEVFGEVYRRSIQP